MSSPVPALKCSPSGPANARLSLLWAPTQRDRRSCSYRQRLGRWTRSPHVAIDGCAFRHARGTLRWDGCAPSCCRWESSSPGCSACSRWRAATRLRRGLPGPPPRSRRSPRGSRRCAACGSIPDLSRSGSAPQQARREGLEDLDRSYPESRRKADEEVLKLLGLIEPDVDLRSISASIFGEGVAGYYDPRSKRLRIVSGTTPDALERDGARARAHARARGPALRAVAGGGGERRRRAGPARPRRGLGDARHAAVPAAPHRNRAGPQRRCSGRRCRPVPTCRSSSRTS